MKAAIKRAAVVGTAVAIAGAAVAVVGSAHGARSDGVSTRITHTSDDTGWGSSPLLPVIDGHTAA